MLIDIFNFFRGYVLLEITGFSVERFMNLVTYNNIYLWDIKRNQNGVILKVSIRGFKLLKKYARKTGCKIKILKKNGLPFEIYKYKKRKIFAGGIIFFIGFLYLLSSFVWFIDIKGNKKIDSNRILKFCESKNLKFGCLKYKLNIKELERDLLNNFNEISWINIKLKGTRAIINIKEIISKQKIIDKRTPCNIIAKKNGLILNVITSSGTPKVKINDVVKKGDILVSGEVLIENNNSETSQPSVNYVHADAKVMAKTYYEMNFKVPYEYIFKKYTGQTKKNYILELYNKKISLSNGIKFINYDKISSVKELRFNKNYALPIKIFINEYHEFEPIKKRRSIQQAKDIADKIIMNRIIREFDFDTDIYDKKLEFINNKDCLYIKALISTIERIEK